MFSRRAARAIPASVRESRTVFLPDKTIEVAVLATPGENIFHCAMSCSRIEEAGAAKGETASSVA